MQACSDLVEALASAELCYGCLGGGQRGLHAALALHGSDNCGAHLFQWSQLRRAMLENLEDGDAVFAELHRPAHAPLCKHCIAEYSVIQFGVGPQRQAAGTAFELLHLAAAHAEFLRQFFERGAGALQALLQLILPAAELGNRQLVAQGGRKFSAYLLEFATRLGPDAIDPDDVIAELGLHRLADLAGFHGKEFVGKTPSRRHRAWPSPGRHPWQRRRCPSNTASPGRRNRHRP